ncbi:MAG TPA: hypothetical protein VMX38_05740 [Verrucomicrobiae bacterium]|jgi:eukaryotic-like serine/threonine-protein kinase|nr:hypothetical protein [Verrucomicrobiae bacterium]
MRVKAGGGTPVPLTTLDPKESTHRWPDFLPDSNHFLYFADGKTSPHNGIYLAALDSKERKLLLAYAAPGYLLFVRENTLMSQRFNLRSLALEGDAKPLADHVAVNTYGEVS